MAVLNMPKRYAPVAELIVDVHEIALTDAFDTFAVSEK